MLEAGSPQDSIAFQEYYMHCICIRLLRGESLHGMSPFPVLFRGSTENNCIHLLLACTSCMTTDSARHTKQRRDLIHRCKFHLATAAHSCMEGPGLQSSPGETGDLLPKWRVLELILQQYSDNTQYFYKKLSHMLAHLIFSALRHVK